MSGGVQAIAAERARQIKLEGWASVHDDVHVRGEIAGAAACYLLHGLDVGRVDLKDRVRALVIELWPWAADWWKPKDRRRDLVRAGALIAAEIDRLDRLEARRGAK